MTLSMLKEGILLRSKKDFVSLVLKTDRFFNSINVRVFLSFAPSIFFFMESY